MTKFLQSHNPSWSRLNLSVQLLPRIELADNRTADQWGKHYDDILDNGFNPKQLTNDAFVWICAANAAKFEWTPWQLDTFHSIAHRLGDWDRKLEKAIKSAIKHATECEDKLASAKSEPVIDKRLNLCFEADKAVEKARQLHDNFSYLYREIIHQLNTFDSLAIWESKIMPKAQLKWRLI